MSRIVVLLCLAAMPGLAGCAAHPVAPRAAASVTMEPEAAWRRDLASADAARIDGLAARWRQAWTLAGRRGARTMRAEGDLLRADAALDHPALPPGSYKCRALTVAAGIVRKSPAFFCYIGGEAGDRVSFTKQTGTARPGGWLYRDTDAPRYVFLGAEQRRAGDTSLGYGTDPRRNLVGVAERIGPFRWRLVLPGPPFQVYELTPVPVEQQGATS